MSLNKISPRVYAVSLGFVNAFLIEGDGLTLIDTAIPGQAGRILAAVRDLGRQPGDLRRILITHLHADHTGSLAVLQRASGAQVWMHAADAALVSEGVASRPSYPPPGWMSGLLFKLMFGARRGPSRVKASAVDHPLNGDETLPDLGSKDLEVRAVHTPGHTAGHLAYHLPQAGVLIAGDAVTHWLGIGHPPIYEDLAMGRESLRRIAGLDYEILCFSHGKPVSGAALATARARIRQLAA